MMKRRLTAASLLMVAPVTAALVLSGCVASSGSVPVNPADNPLLRPAPMQDYVPGGEWSQINNRPSSAQPSSSQPEASDGSGRRTNQPRARGSSTPPDQLTPPIAPLALPKPPGPRDSADDTTRFKRDLLQPKIDSLQHQDRLNRLDPFQQRDLMNRQLELYRLEKDRQR